MNSETLGRNARRLLRKPAYASIGIVIAVFSVTTLVIYWVTLDPALTAVVSTAVPTVVFAFTAVLFIAASRTKQ